MGVELIRKAVCDRCGGECSHILERTLREDFDGRYNIKIKQMTTIAYHYTEMTLSLFDHRSTESAGKTFVLCGDCVNKLGEWLKNEETDGDDNG